MKKRSTALMLVLFLLLIASVTLLAQRNPRGTARFEKNGQFVMIEYGRPSLKGRDMLGQLEAGKTWRMGSDKSTTLTCSSALSFGKVNIAAGSYSLWLRKRADKSFELVINKATGQWGTEHNVTDDLASVPLTPSQGTDKVEQFTLNLKEAGKGGEFQLLWDTTILTAGFTLK